MRRKLWAVLLLLGLVLIISSIALPKSLEFVSLSIGFFLAMLGVASK
jgi:hypothetical protein